MFKSDEASISVVHQTEYLAVYLVNEPRFIGASLPKRACVAPLRYRS